MMDFRDFAWNSSETPALHDRDNVLESLDKADYHPIKQGSSELVCNSAESFGFL
jgi:hypothetical protein